MNEINLSILILVFLLLISALLIFIIYKLRSCDSDSKLVDDLQKLVGNNQDMITKNFGDLEGTVKTKLENFYDKIKDENNRSSESLSNMLNKISCPCLLLPLEGLHKLLLHYLFQLHAKHQPLLGSLH